MSNEQQETLFGGLGGLLCRKRFQIIVYDPIGKRETLQSHAGGGGVSDKMAAAMEPGLAGKPKRAQSSSKVSDKVGNADISKDDVIHQGWAVKESGTSNFLGKTNWRRRWFILANTSKGPMLQYFKNQGDTTPAGYVALNIMYCTRQMESKVKGKPFCFAVGPLVDNGATRTFFISCSSSSDMHKWITAIDAAVQGAGSKAQERMKKMEQRYKEPPQPPPQSSLQQQQTMTETGVKILFRHHSILTEETTGFSPLSRTDSMVSHTEGEESVETFFTQEGFEYCTVMDVDLESVIPEDSISDDEEMEPKSLTPSSSFTSNGACNKSGMDSADCKHWGQLLCVCEEAHLEPSERLALYRDRQWRLKKWEDLCKVAFSTNWYKTDTKDGVTICRNKFGRGTSSHATILIEGIVKHYPETLLQFFQLTTKPGGKLDYLFRNEMILDRIADDEDWPVEVVFNSFQVPLPKVATRDIVAMKTWIADPNSQHTGLLMFSVDHPSSPPIAEEVTRIHVLPSGLILTHHPEKDKLKQTKVTIVVQILLGSGLHRMMKGAYNSGLLKLGLRSSFQHMRDQFTKFEAMANI